MVYNPCSSGGKLVYGNGPPSNDIGINGDFYVDMINQLLYGPKMNNYWGTTSITLQGIQGPIGNQGEQGLQGLPGSTFSENGDVIVNDVFISGTLTTSDIFVINMSVTESLYGGSVYVNEINVESLNVNNIIVNDIIVNGSLTIDNFNIDEINVNESLFVDIINTDIVTITGDLTINEINVENIQINTLITENLNVYDIHSTESMTINSLNVNEIYVSDTMNGGSVYVNNVDVISITADNVTGDVINITDNFTFDDNIITDDITVDNVNADIITVDDITINPGVFASNIIQTNDLTISSNLDANNITADNLTVNGTLTTDNLTVNGNIVAEKMIAENSAIARYFSVCNTPKYEVFPIGGIGPGHMVQYVSAYTIDGTGRSLMYITKPASLSPTSVYKSINQGKIWTSEIIASGSVDFVDISFSADFTFGIVANNGAGNSLYIFKSNTWTGRDIDNSIEYNTTCCSVSPDGINAIVCCYITSNPYFFIYYYDSVNDGFILYESLVNYNSCEIAVRGDNSIAYYITSNSLPSLLKYSFSFTNVTPSGNLNSVNINDVREVIISGNQQYILVSTLSGIYYFNYLQPTTQQILDLPILNNISSYSIGVNNDVSIIMIAGIDAISGNLLIYMKKGIESSYPWVQVYSIFAPSTHYELKINNDAYYQYIVPINSNIATYYKALYAPSYLGAILPIVDGCYRIGNFGLTFEDIYLVFSPIIVSDRNKKKLISDCDLGLSFIDKLRPVKYQLINSDKFNYGLISQEVKDALLNNNKDPESFAGYVHGNVNGETHYYLRYNEFIAPLIKTNQELYEMAKQVKEKLDYYLSKIN